MSNILAENKFGTGGQKDNYDNRDYQYKDIARAAIPFDWNKGFDIEEKLSTALKIPNFKIPVKDQGTSSSCGGQAWSYYAEVLEAIATGTFEERSAKYLYAQSHAEGGGSSGRANADIFKNQGVCREVILSSYPATEENLTNSRDITNPIRYDAKSDVATLYANTGTNINDIAIAMRDNNGVVVGITGENNGTWTTAFPKPPKNAEWRHWIFSGKARVINGIKFIGLLNSWGKDVGDKSDPGWQWLSEEYINTVIRTPNGYETALWSGWTHIFKDSTDHQPYSFAIDLKFGDEGEEVKALQSALVKLGYLDPKYITGYYYNITALAVLKFQIDNKVIYPTSILKPFKGHYFGIRTRIAMNHVLNII